MTALPSPRHLIASLISTVSNDEPSTTTTEGPATSTTTGNPLKDAPSATQKVLLTLHALFPNELLPALDLLYRGLVTRFILTRAEGQSGNEGETERGRKPTAVHHVQSAQQQHQHSSSRYRSAATTTTSYEVRLQSWNCSCPAFAFAAFPAATGSEPASSSSSAAAEQVPGQSRMAGNADWTFGGLTRGTDVPVCKHLLACVLVEHCEMFRPFAEEREISVEELAGWAAGWGD